MELDYQKKSQEIINWIKKTVLSTAFQKVVIGLSGGIDSAVSAGFMAKALGPKNVHVLILPYNDLSSIHVSDAKSVTEFLKIPKENTFVIDIKNPVDAIVSSSSDHIRKGNIMARVRMIYIFDFAKKINALVSGTENKTEHMLGYFTRFGDEASDIEPIVSLYKTQVWEMGKYLGLPEEIISKSPTAGLWENQTDEGEFGFTYKDADQVLYWYFDQKMSVEDIISKGISKDIVEKVLEKVKKNEFKQKTPYIFIPPHA